MKLKQVAGGEVRNLPHTPSYCIPLLRKPKEQTEISKSFVHLTLKLVLRDGTYIYELICGKRPTSH